MTIRKTTWEDFPEIQQIYAYAREQMRQNGNPLQWGDDRPSAAALSQDIQAEASYVMEEGGRICGVFSFIMGDDPTYARIEQGHWLNEAPYGTIHRLAGNGTVRGLFGSCLAFCASLHPNIRIDTHADNLLMQHLLEKHRFVKCGIIHVEDGSPRIACQRICPKNAAKCAVSTDIPSGPESCCAPGCF